MNRTKLQQELLMYRFETTYDEWQTGHLTQEEAASVGRAPRLMALP